MKNVLVIGGGGFIGKHLVNNLYNQKNCRVYTVDIADYEGFIGNGKYIGDIRTPGFLEKCIKEVQPDLVYYLVSFFSFNDIDNYTSSIKNSLICLHNLFKSLAFRQRLVFIGSSAQYGKVPVHLQPVHENTGFYPVSSYGVFKIFEEYEIRRLADKHNIDIVGARIFNVTGPGEPTRMVGGSIVSQLKNSNKVNMGNLYPKRDFLDVRDVANALIFIGEKGESNEIYNICSGKSISIKYYLQLIAKELNVKPIVRTNENKVNLNDIKNLVGDNTKLIDELGWQTNYEILQSIKDMIKSF